MLSYPPRFNLTDAHTGQAIVFNGDGSQPESTFGFDFAYSAFFFAIDTFRLLGTLHPRLVERTADIVVDTTVNAIRQTFKRRKKILSVMQSTLGAWIFGDSGASNNGFVRNGQVNVIPNDGNLFTDQLTITTANSVTRV